MTDADPPAHTVDRQGSVAIVHLDRPPVNALTYRAWQQLVARLVDLSQDVDVRVVIIHGGEGQFCAGADIAELAQPDPEADDAAMLTVVADTARAVRACRAPVIAAIDGPAHGGGLELALACDIRLASGNATFAASGINMGLIASVSSLVTTAGDTAARRMLLTGERIDAATALSWGLSLIHI